MPADTANRLTGSRDPPLGMPVRSSEGPCCPGSLHRWVCRQGVLGGLWLQGPPVLAPLTSWKQTFSCSLRTGRSPPLPRPQGRTDPAVGLALAQLRWPRGDATERVQAGAGLSVPSSPRPATEGFPVWGPFSVEVRI